MRLATHLPGIKQTHLQVGGTRPMDSTIHSDHNIRAMGMGPATLARIPVKVEVQDRIKTALVTLLIFTETTPREAWRIGAGSKDLTTPLKTDNKILTDRPAIKQASPRKSTALCLWMNQRE